MQYTHCTPMLPSEFQLKIRNEDWTDRLYLADVSVTGKRKHTMYVLHRLLVAAPGTV